MEGEDEEGKKRDRRGVKRDWAWEGESGAGERECEVDSGVDEEHKDVGGDVE